MRLIDTIQASLITKVNIVQVKTEEAAARTREVLSAAATKI